MKTKSLLCWFAVLVLTAIAGAAPLWEIGKADRNDAEFALAPKNYSKFSEDGFFVVGASDAKTAWPYVHPGPHDGWAGNREHTFSIVFGVKQAVAAGNCKFIVDLVDTQYGTPPKLRIEINGQKFERQTPVGCGNDDAIFGNPARGKPYQIAIEFPASLLKAGNNTIEITSVAGSWMLYDHLALEAPADVAALAVTNIVKVVAMQPVSALIDRGGKLFQPVKLSLLYCGEPVEASVRAGDAEVDRVQLKNGKQTIEALLRAVEKESDVPVSLVANGKVIASESLKLEPVRKWTVYILMHSHVDIGYTDIQPNIAKKQAHNIARALELIRETKDYPEGARFKWNLEVGWPSDQFLATATPEQKKEFEQAIHDGGIGVDAMWCNLLTGVCRGEELLRQFSFETELGRRCGQPVDSMMISDVPGLTWGTVTACAQAGVKYISDGPNYADRIGWTRVTWEDKPFWWLGPDGKSKVLYWAPYFGYAFGHTIDKITDAVEKDLRKLEAENYPYDIVQMRWSKGDNGSADERVMQQVKEWNAKYSYPKLVIATTSEMFHGFEKRYGDKLPSFRGDFTPYWEDGVGSAARETAMNRHSADRLVQAEALWALLKPAKYPAAEFQAAWKNVAMWSEHTWGAHCSISKPDSDFTKEQWKYKQAYALDADSQSRKLLADAFANRGAPVPNAVDVFFTDASMIPHALITIPKELSQAGDWVKGSPTSEYTYVSQRLTSGDLIFTRCNGGIDGQRYFITPERPKEPVKWAGYGGSADARAAGVELKAGRLTLRVEEKTGGIASLRFGDKELVDTNAPTGLNDFFYLIGGDVTKVQRNGPVKISVKERGPLIASLLVESDAPGCRKLVREYRVRALREYVEIIDTVDKLPIREKEGVHFGFAFNVSNGVAHVNSAWALAEPEKDQIPGACKNWFSAENFVDISDGKDGVTWITLDAPLVEIGGITANLPAGQPNPKAYMEHIAPSQTLYSWAMNNHWHTNYKADQDGPTIFRFVIRPYGTHGGYTPESIAAEYAYQPVVVAAAGLPPQSSSPFHVSGYIMSSFKPSDDGKAWIIRLFNPSRVEQKANLQWIDLKPASVSLSDLSERHGEPAGDSLVLPPYGIATLRAELP